MVGVIRLKTKAHALLDDPRRARPRCGVLLLLVGRSRGQRRRVVVVVVEQQRREQRVVVVELVVRLLRRFERWDRRWRGRLDRPARRALGRFPRRRPRQWLDGPPPRARRDHRRAREPLRPRDLEQPVVQHLAGAARAQERDRRLQGHVSGAGAPCVERRVGPRDRRSPRRTDGQEPRRAPRESSLRRHRARRPGRALGRDQDDDERRQRVHEPGVAEQRRRGPHLPSRPHLPPLQARDRRRRVGGGGDLLAPGPASDGARGRRDLRALADARPRRLVRRDHLRDRHERSGLHRRLIAPLNVGRSRSGSPARSCSPESPRLRPQDRSCWRAPGSSASRTHTR